MAVWMVGAEITRRSKTKAICRPTSLAVSTPSVLIPAESSLTSTVHLPWICAAFAVRTSAAVIAAGPRRNLGSRPGV
jgi:hypothetical protein